MPAGDAVARALTWIDGTLWVDAPSASPARLRSLGAAVARVDRALAGFDHAHLDRQLRWNLATAAEQRELLPFVADPGRRAAAGAVLDRFAGHVAPALAALPAQAVHNDANDRNVLVDGDAVDRVTGLLDFGDPPGAARVRTRRRGRLRPRGGFRGRAARGRRVPRRRAAHAGRARAAARPRPHPPRAQHRDGRLAVLPRA